MTNLIYIGDVLVNVPRYATGLEVVWASNTTFIVSIGVARDSTDTAEIVVTSPITVDSSKRGPGGFDTGTLIEAIYGVYLIGDSTGRNAVSAMFSIGENLIPVMPGGYDMYRRIGTISMDASFNFILAYQVASSDDQRYFYDTSIPALSGGTANTFTAIFLGPWIPNTPRLRSSSVTLNVFFTPNAAGDTCAFRAFGSSDATGYVISGSAAGKVTATTIEIPIPKDRAAYIEYKVATSGSLSLSVIGFSDSLN